MQRYKEMKNEESSMKNYFPYFLFFILLSPLPLSDGLEQQDGSTDGYVERVKAPQHGDANVGISSLAPLLGKPCGLRSHHNGSRTSHRGIVVEA